VVQPKASYNASGLGLYAYATEKIGGNQAAFERAKPGPYPTRYLKGKAFLFTSSVMLRINW